MRILQGIQVRLDDNCFIAAATENKAAIEQAISDKAILEMTVTESCALCTPGD